MHVFIFENAGELEDVGKQMIQQATSTPDKLNAICFNATMTIAQQIDLLEITLQELKSRL